MHARANEEKLTSVGNRVDRLLRLCSIEWHPDLSVHAVLLLLGGHRVIRRVARGVGCTRVAVGRLRRLVHLLREVAT